LTSSRRFAPPADPSNRYRLWHQHWWEPHEAQHRHGLTSEERWILAELLRLKGELALLQDLPNAAAIAADHFQKSLALARRQGELAWELRSATSLAGCGIGRERRDRRARCWQPSTADSPKVSIPPMS
jgi:predicted ATPase